MKRKPIEEHAIDVAGRLTKKNGKLSPAVSAYEIGYSWGAYDGWLSGYRAGQRSKRKRK